MLHELRVLSGAELGYIDYIVVLSGPRSDPDGWCRRRNCNPARIRAGLELQAEYGVPLLVSGSPYETKQLRKEVEQVRRELKLPKSAVKMMTCSRSTHTVGNAIHSQRIAHWELGFDPLPSPKAPSVLAVVTSDWHAPRAELDFRGVQRLMIERNLVWSRSKPFEFRFVGVSSDDLQPSYWQQLAREEVSKYEADKERLERWMSGREFDDAPAAIKNTLGSPKDFDSSAERELAEGLRILGEDSPNPFRLPQGVPGRMINL